MIEHGGGGNLENIPVSAICTRQAKKGGKAARLISLLKRARATNRPSERDRKEIQQCVTPLFFLFLLERKKENDHAIHHERRSGQGFLSLLFPCRSTSPSLLLIEYTHTHWMYISIYIRIDIYRSFKCIERRRDRCVYDIYFVSFFLSRKRSTHKGTSRTPLFTHSDSSRSRPSLTLHIHTHTQPFLCNPCVSFCL